MLLYKDITNDIKDKDVLRAKATDVEIPLSDSDINALYEMNEYLFNGYDDEFVEKNDIRPGVGIAAPQIGLSKKMFCIAAFDEKGDFHNFCVVNPKIISHSEQLTYLETGEGCLSVNDAHKGYIHRYRKIKARGYFLDFENSKLEYKTIELKGYLAIVFQHEYDHLFGKLFYDHINKENPFYVPENSVPVKFTVIDE